MGIFWSSSESILGIVHCRCCGEKSNFCSWTVAPSSCCCCCARSPLLLLSPLCHFPITSFPPTLTLPLQRLGLVGEEVDVADEVIFKSKISRKRPWQPFDFCSLFSQQETNINILFDMALERIAFLPFGYLVDKFRSLTTHFPL